MERLAESFVFGGILVALSLAAPAILTVSSAPPDTAVVSAAYSVPQGASLAAPAEDDSAGAVFTEPIPPAPAATVPIAAAGVFRACSNGSCGSNAVYSNAQPARGPIRRLLGRRR